MGFVQDAVEGAEFPAWRFEVEDPCMKSILCGLNAVAKDALVSFINVGILTPARAQVAIWKAWLLQFDVAVIPVQLARGFADAVLKEAKAYTQIIPLGLFQGCSDLGDLNLFAANIIDDFTADAHIVLDDLERLLSFKEELEALIQEAEKTIAYFITFLSLIEGCDSK